MGGWGSGAGRGATKTSELKRIDLACLRQLGILQVGRHSKLVWSRGGERVGDVDIEMREGALIFDYRVREHGGEWEAITEFVRLVSTVQNLGGERVWFECPGCRRRRRVLYGGRLFRCRRCYALTYPSQYEDANDRIMTRAQNARIRLGGDGGMDEPFPRKPKWMRWRTYRRHETLDECATAAFVAKFLNFERRGMI